MAQERSDLDKYDRVDPSDYTVREGGNTGETPRNTPMEQEFSSGDRADTSRDEDDTHTQETEQIKGQIQETRNQMGETLDAIQDRLSFSNISEQVSEHVQNAVDTAKDAVYDATIGKAAGIMKNMTSNISNSTIVETAKSNPLPFVLIGAGVGLLAYKSYVGDSASRRSDMSKYRNRRSQMNQGSFSESSQSSLDQMSEKVSSATSGVLEKASTAYDNATASAAQMMDQAYGKVGEVRGMAMDKYNTYLQDNPLVLGAAAIAVGAAFGMAIPSTAYESKLLGETRNNVLDKAQTTAAGLLEKTKQAVVDAGHEIPSGKGSMSDH